MRTHLVPVDPLLFEPGDRLALADFLARWERMPSLKFAELVDGVVHVPSPLSYEHGRRDGLAQLVLGTYAARTGVCELVSNATWVMLDSAPQPDVALRLLPEYGGGTTVEGKLAAGAPELIVEICQSRRCFDLGPKLALYQQAGVSEFAAVLLEERRIEWRVLEGREYRLHAPGEALVYQSAVFPGLWLDEGAFWLAEPRRLLAVLEDGLRSPACQRFLDRVRAR
jgi:hypothetical protein